MRSFVKISLNEFKKKLKESNIVDADSYPQFTPIIDKDLSKVNFDFENTDTLGPDQFLGYHVLPNGMPYLGCCAGGDWENSVYFCIYWDGTNLRGYIPTDGNLWNTDTKQAYGNNDIADLKNARKRWPNNEDLKHDDIDLGGYLDNYDIVAMKKDIMVRIVEKGTNKTNPLAKFSSSELKVELKSRGEYNG